MPLYQLSETSIRPFRRLHSEAEIYERQIEELFWSNLEAFAGEPLFAVARQPTLPGGGKPDIVALDPDGRLVVIEIKRDVDRSQLSQCLEYAGWARQSSLDEVSRLYRAGHEQFFADWQAFTSTATPLLLKAPPRLLLVARAFDGRTKSAFDFLFESGVPVKLITILFYEDSAGQQIVDVNTGSEFLVAGRASQAAGPDAVRDGLASGDQPSEPRSLSGVTLSDLLEAGMLTPDEPIEWRRPQLGDVHHATIAPNGEVVLSDGQRFTSLSAAANALAGYNNNGWLCWTVPRLGGVSVGALRN